jgi:dienelactone hydrolase
LAALFFACDNDGNPGTSDPQEIPDHGAYKSPDEYLVDVFENYTVHDASRKRDIKILIRYPFGAQNPLPVIIWSHGGGANPNGHNTYKEWGEALARAGYAVIHIAHEEAAYNAHCANLGIPASECEPLDFTKEVSAGGTLDVLWYNRPRDASAVINDLANIEAASGLQFDRSRLGAGGHAGGAHMVMNLAGAYVDIAPSVRARRSYDVRFVAFLACSPQGIGRLGMTEDSWSRIGVPMMVQTGAADAEAEENAAGRLQAFHRMSPPEKYLLYLDSPGATHNTFALNAEANNAWLEPYVRASAIAFFDAYLRSLPGAKAWLASGKINTWSSGAARITMK